LLLTAHGNGRIGFGGIVWGRERRLESFAKLVARKCDPQTDYRMLIGHGAALADAQYLAQRIQTLRPRVKLLGITQTGAALAVHGGPGFLVVSAQRLINSAVDHSL
jgi:fatty acid-binding protein DegV